MASIYDYELERADGSRFSLAENKGKVMIIVNTATGCGFTPHYEPLEALYEKYHEQGLEIIDIPCNQFAGQAPESDQEIHEFCQLKYHTQFEQFKKSEVNGDHQLDLYRYLKSQKGFEGFGKGPKALAMSALLLKMDRNYKKNPDIKWNFTKFLVDRDGNVIGRYEPTYDMGKFAEEVGRLFS